MYIDYTLYNVDGQEPEWVPEFKRCRKWLEDALEFADNTFNIIDVADGIASGNMQFWPEKDTAAISQIVDYPRKRVIHVFLLGGNMEGAKALEKKMTVWGK